MKLYEPPVKVYDQDFVALNMENLDDQTNERKLERARANLLLIQRRTTEAKVRREQLVDDKSKLSQLQIHKRDLIKNHRE